jgi:hypothetical protein
VVEPSGYTSLISLLEQTGLFAAVDFGTPSDPLTQQDYPLCWVRPKSFEALDEVDPIQTQTTESFEIEVRVRVENGEGGLATFYRLETLVRDTRKAIDHQQLGDCLPGLTFAKSGRYSERYPTSTALIYGSFSRLDNGPITASGEEQAEQAERPSEAA